MTPLNWAILAVAVLGIAAGCWWWGYEQPRRERRRREAIWAQQTSWVSEGEPPPDLALWLEVLRRALPDWLGGWGGVLRWSPVSLRTAYGSQSGDLVRDPDRAVVELQRVFIACAHGLWHVNEQRHGQTGEPPEEWLLAAEAEIARRSLSS